MPLRTNGTFRTVATILALLLAGVVGAVGTGFAYSSQVASNTNDIGWLKQAIVEMKDDLKEIKGLLTPRRR